MSDLNESLLAAALALPQRRGYHFAPSPRASDADPANPRDPDHDGVSRTLRAGGEVVARADPEGRTFCCGVTFEAWFDATGGAGLDAPGLRDLLTDWFCPVMGHDGVASALVSRGFGHRVALGDARPGDLCQFWRSTDLVRPSGHSVVFLGHTGGRLHYWSSQRATDGIGVHSEEIGAGWTLAVVRATR